MDNFYIEIIDKYGDIIHRILNIPNEEEMNEKIEMLTERNYYLNAYCGDKLMRSTGTLEITTSYFSNDFVECPLGENFFENPLEIY